MKGNDLEATRREVLERLGGDPDAVETVLAYCASPFDRGILPEPPVFPLETEPHVEDWRRYAGECGDDAFAYLQERIPQLSIPVKKGVSATDAYADAARRGKPFEEEAFGGRASLARPDAFRLYIHEHPAGALPVMVTSDRADFEQLYRALGCRCEPEPLQASVNAHMIAGFINWDRVRRYREAWEREPEALLAPGGWGAEMSRVAKNEPWRFKDRFIILFENAYSAVAAKDLGLDMDEAAWRAASTVLRAEHEFTHYATKRLYGTMRNNLLDETIADFMGITAALGEYRASWFLAFMGLERFPEVRETGRIFTYRGELAGSALDLLCALVVEAARGLETLGERFYDPAERGRFFLALASMTLELLACERAESIFDAAYE